MGNRSYSKLLYFIIFNSIAYSEISKDNYTTMTLTWEPYL